MLASATFPVRPPDVAPPPRHSPATMILHWGAAVLLVAGFALGLMLDDWPRGVVRDQAMMIHYSLGTMIAAVALIRLMCRLLLPPVGPAGTGLAARAATAMHWALYAAMVGLPLTGALDRWARGRQLTVFGDIVIPPPFPIPGGKLWKEGHELLAWTLAAMVATHALAALWHHVALRDDTLRRMVPKL